MFELVKQAQAICYRNIYANQDKDSRVRSSSNTEALDARINARRIIVFKYVR